MTSVPQSIGSRQIAVCLLGAIAAGAVLVTAIPIDWRRERIEVEVVATGERNPLARSNEVWVRWEDAAGTPIDPHSWTAGAGWIVKEGSRVFTGSDPSRLAWTGTLNSGSRLRFVRHPWSGVAAIRVNGTERRVDLYAGSGEEMIVDLRGTPDAAGNIRRWCLWVVSLGTLAVSTALALARLRPRSRTGIPLRDGLGFVLVCTAVWTVCLLAFWPGISTSDITDQLQQALTGDYNSAHPVFHTLLLGVATRLFGSPAGAAATQIVVLACALSTGLLLHGRLGLSRRAAWIICIAIALLPTNGLMVVHLWKDIPFAIGLVGFTLFLLRALSASPEAPSGGLGLGLSAAALALFRYNGIPVAMLSLALAASVRHLRPAAFRAGGVAVFLLIVVSGPLSQQLGITRSTGRNLDPILAQLAAHVNAGTPMSPEDEAYVRGLRSDWTSRCEQRVFDVVFDGELNRELLARDVWRPVQVWARLFVQAPRVDIDQVLCASTVAWRIRPVTEPDSGAAVWTTPSGELRWSFDLAAFPDPSQYVDADRLLRGSSFLPDVGSAIFDVATWSGPLHAWQLILWRPALTLYLWMFVAAVACLRTHSALPLLVLAPTLIHTLVLIPLAPSPDYRYQYPVQLAFLVVGLPMLWWRRAPGGDEPRHGADSALGRTPVPR